VQHFYTADTLHVMSLSVTNTVKALKGTASSVISQAVTKWTSSIQMLLIHR